MKAFLVETYEKQGALRLADVPDPVVGDSDVLVDVHAASLNPLDAKLRDGAFKPILPYRPPFILGHDVAGVVIGVGKNVRTYKPGDAIYARPRDHRIGTLAERIAIHEDDVALKPKTLSMEEAASIPLVALTAWQVLVERADVKPGQTVLIHAGSGGVGTIAIQLARHLGATVATTTSTTNVALVTSLGADVVIDYKMQDFSKILSGIDVVLNTLDSDTLQKSVGVLKPGGQLISISGPPDVAFTKAIGANWFLQQVMRVLSAGIRRRAARRGATYAFHFMHASGDQLRAITTLIEAGIIRPVVDRVFPFEATNEAMTALETGRSKGKIVVRMK